MMFDKPYTIKGKHATYARFLSATTGRLDKEAKVAGIFKTTVEMYVVAPLIGAAYNRKADEDKDSSDSYTIFGDAIIGQQENLDAAYRLIMLADNSAKLTSDEKIARAFKEDEIPDKVNQNLELFHQYMRGGIEWLYEQTIEGATTKEDYLAKVDAIVSQFIQDFPRI